MDKGPWQVTCRKCGQRFQNDQDGCAVSKDGRSWTCVYCPEGRRTNVASGIMDGGRSPARPKSGIIALQPHRGEPMEVHFTNIRIKPLTESAHSPPAEAKIR